MRKHNKELLYQTTFWCGLASAQWVKQWCVHRALSNDTIPNFIQFYKTVIFISTPKHSLLSNLSIRPESRVILFILIFLVSLFCWFYIIKPLFISQFYDTYKKKTTYSLIESYVDNKIKIYIIKVPNPIHVWFWSWLWCKILEDDNE